MATLCYCLVWFKERRSRSGDSLSAMTRKRRVSVPIADSGTERPGGHPWASLRRGDLQRSRSRSTRAGDLGEATGEWAGNPGFSKADEGYCLTVHDSNVVLAPHNSRDGTKSGDVDYGSGEPTVRIYCEGTGARAGDPGEATGARAGVPGERTWATPAITGDKTGVPVRRYYSVTNLVGSGSFQKTGDGGFVSVFIGVASGNNNPFSVAVFNWFLGSACGQSEFVLLLVVGPMGPTTSTWSTCKKLTHITAVRPCSSSSTPTFILYLFFLVFSFMLFLSFLFTSSSPVGISTPPSSPPPSSTAKQLNNVLHQDLCSSSVTDSAASHPPALGMAAFYPPATSSTTSLVRRRRNSMTPP